MSEIVKAPTGKALSCKGWVQEAAMRLLMNNLDPEVAEKPQELIVYGGIVDEQITHRIELTQPEDVDDQVISWLKTAYGRRKK